MSTPHDPAPSADHAPEEGVRITDRRRIDPITGQPRPAPAGAAGAAAPGDPTGPADPTGAATGGDAASSQVADLTADLQRITAEYANYRRRVERDRLAQRDAATAATVQELLPVLDDIGRARAHGDLSGTFATVADRLQEVVTRLGLQPVGQVGEPFDPAHHEAISAHPDDTVTETLIDAVVTPGYRVGERLLRPALVSVRMPAGSGPGESG